MTSTTARPGAPTTSGRAATLAGFRDVHRGASVLVCGCGESLNLLERPERFVTIGVNDVGRLFTPDYLVVVNPRSQFAGDRFRHVEESRAKALFTQLPDLGVRHPNVVRFRLGRYGGADFSDPDALHYTKNSPYVAVCLAVHMGARRIGLLGVDFTEHHFFGRTGVHPLAQRLGEIDREYARLAASCRARGVEIVNLGPASRLTSIPKASLAAFGSESASERPRETRRAGLRIVSYATTPVAGVPLALARCIEARTDADASCVWARNDYGNGVRFESGVEWTRDAKSAELLVREADAVIVHNGRIDARHARLFEDKPVVTLAHNYMWNVDRTFVERGYPGLVVGQYQAVLPEFASWTPVANPVPFWEPGYLCDGKPPVVTVCYTPSGRHERYAPGHRLYWHGKGYDTTMRVLDALAAGLGIAVETVRGGNVAHDRSLAMKRRAHIVIDECVTGSYHRNSLEGLAAGCVVVNGVGLFAGVADVMRRCAGGAQDVPFVSADLGSLQSVLVRLIELGPDALAERGRENRRWLERHWDFESQWERTWKPAIDSAIGRAGRRPRAAIVAAPASASRAGVSVVVPHGGAERLPHLSASLANLASVAGVSEVIVAEMGTSPFAAEPARRWGAKYVFLRNDGAFERARTLNAGAALAEHDLVLWKDNDLLMPASFVESASAEFRSRGLDFLLPYASIHYLAAEDSRRVMSGACDPGGCRPARILRAGRDVSGGAGLVAARFLEKHGGIPDSFRGWGGEDNAWAHKARLLGRSGVTARADQRMFHLFHPDSGAQGLAAGRANPHYPDNVALLGRMRLARDAREFLARFPGTGRRTCPWTADRRVLVLHSEGADAAAARAVVSRLRSLYGADAGTLDVAAFGAEMRSTLSGVAADAVVLADDQVSREFLDEPAAESLRPRCVCIGADAGAPGVAGMLSLVLAGHPASPAAAKPDGAVDMNHETPPTWLYWEGECPAWIRMCESTIRRHGGDVRVLGPAEFDALWDRDRDIGIGKLHVAHRADFIRAFLLARFGGLWIDMDCVATRPLGPVLDLLREHDFVAHRDRQGYYPNGFMAARPGSRIAADLYRAVCARIRSGRRLGWISLGGELLTQTLKTTRAGWHELGCALVQPVCWSEPGVFFAKGTPQEHERRFDAQAFCYMMSNTEVRKHMTAHPSLDLTSGGTFFRWLIDRSAVPRVPADSGLAAAFERIFRDGERRGEESVSGPGSCPVHTVQIRGRVPQLFEDLGVRSVFDAGCGDFSWMRHAARGVEHVIGWDVVPGVVERARRGCASAMRTFECRDATRDTPPRCDLVVCRDVLVHLPHGDALRALRGFRESGSTYLLATTFPRVRANIDVVAGDWRPLNLELPPFGFPSPLRLIDEQCAENGGRYADKSLGLWRLADLQVQ